jgi:hypothetical protein
VSEEFQPLKVSISFSLIWDFCMNTHFSHTTASDCKLSALLTIVQEWCFANGVSQNMLWTHNF